MERSIVKTISRNSRLVPNIQNVTSKKGSKIKVYTSHGEDDDLDNSITTISHFDDIYSEIYWQKQVTNLLKEKKSYL